MASVGGPRRAFPRSVSVTGRKDLSPIFRHDIGVFWDLRRYHLGLDVVSIESIVLAIKYRAALIKNFCSDWLGLDGLNILVRFAVVCDLPSGAALEVQRQQIIRVFDDLEMQFTNIGGHSNPAVARREGIDRFAIQFMKDYPRPLLVVVSDDLRLLLSVREHAGQSDLIAIICRKKEGRATDSLSRRMLNQILAKNIVNHPWDVYFYESVMSVTMTGNVRLGYPKNCLQILYAKTRDTGTLPGPLLAWLVSFALETAVIFVFQSFVFRQCCNKTS